MVIIFVNPSTFFIPRLPVALRYIIIVPVKKKIILAIKLLIISILSLPRKRNLRTGFLSTINLSIFPERKTEIIRRGVTIPRTYNAPIPNDPKKFDERKVRVRIPIRTAAGSALVYQQSANGPLTITVNGYVD